ncbi:MAG: MarR family transcriptional regulator [Anaerolineales bacterium]|nr:MarR family transcriptional regulator [Anaerolineales bacterium]
MPVNEKEMLGRLLSNVCRIHATKADLFLDQLGIYRGQAFLLKTLSIQDGLTHSEIAEILEISPAAATKVIKRLEQYNYIVRKSDPKDERVSRVYIQKAGVAIINHIDHCFQQLNQTMFEGFSKDDLIKFQELLSLIRTNLLNSEPSPEEQQV